MNYRGLLRGFFQRRECVVPTWRAVIVFLCLGIVLMTTGVLTIHPFLSQSKPVRADVLVVEGWVPDYVFEEALVEFKRNNYRKLYVTGGPLEVGGYLSEYRTYAELGAATLMGMGMSKGLVEPVPSETVRQDRTFTSALALRAYCRQQQIQMADINLVSIGAHARRSQMLFQKALGDGVRVGIIAVENRGYESRRWWQSSAGVRTVLDEFIAYIYAAVVFPLVRGET